MNKGPENPDLAWENRIPGANGVACLPAGKTENIDYPLGGICPIDPMIVADDRDRHCWNALGDQGEPGVTGRMTCRRPSGFSNA